MVKMYAGVQKRITIYNLRVLLPYRNCLDWVYELLIFPISPELHSHSEQNAW